VEPGAELHAADAGLVGDVGEGAVALVVIEDVFAVLSDEKIRKAIVVIVAPDAAET
jgi:hypothetical protein